MFKRYLDAYKMTYKQNPPPSGMSKEVFKDKNYVSNLEKLKNQMDQTQSFEDILKSGSLKEVKSIGNSLKEYNFPFQRSALYFAVANPEIAILDYLIYELRLDFDEPSAGGITPLLRAAFYGNLEAIRYLLEAGANPEAKDTLGDNVINILRRRGYYDLTSTVKNIIEDTAKKRQLVEQKSTRQRVKKDHSEQIAQQLELNSNEKNYNEINMSTSKNSFFKEQKKVDNNQEKEPLITSFKKLHIS